jgi:hypothetical protein
MGKSFSRKLDQRSVGIDRRARVRTINLRWSASAGLVCRPRSSLRIKRRILVLHGSPAWTPEQQVQIKKPQYISPSAQGDQDQSSIRLGVGRGGRSWVAGRPADRDRCDDARGERGDALALCGGTWATVTRSFCGDWRRTSDIATPTREDLARGGETSSL